MATYTLLKTSIIEQKQRRILVEKDPMVIVNYVKDLIVDELYIGNYTVFIEHDPVGYIYPGEYMQIATFMTQYGGVNVNDVSA